MPNLVKGRNGYYKNGIPLNNLLYSFSRVHYFRNYGRKRIDDR